MVLRLRLDQLAHRVRLRGLAVEHRAAEEQERILYRNFVNVGMEVKEMIKDVLNKRETK